MLSVILFKRLLNELNISYKALIIGVIGGYIGTLIGLPLPWLLGALGLNLCIAFTNFKIETFVLISRIFPAAENCTFSIYGF